MTAEAEDISAFIQEQKSKLARERQAAPETDQQKTERKKWDKEPAVEPLNMRPNSPEEIGLALEAYGYEEKRQKWLDAKRQEYNVQATPKGKPPTGRLDTPEHKGLAVGGYDDRRRKLQEERKEEYNRLLADKAATSNRRHVETEHTGLQLGSYEEKRKKLDEERRNEYNELIKQQNNKTRPKAMKENLPPAPATPESPLVNKLGSQEDKHRKLQEERRREYNRHLAESHLRRTGERQNEAEDYSGIIPRLQLEERPSAQDRKRRDKEAYKEFLNKQREEQRSRKLGTKPYSRHDISDDEDAPRGKSRRRENDDTNTLPGLRNHTSAEMRKMQERNREYNEYLQSLGGQQRSRSQFERRIDSDEDDRPAPRRGWQTPTYEEILEKKRKEEKNYRRHNDPGYGGIRSSRSETNLNRPLYDFSEEERRFKELDRQYETKKVKFSNETRSRSRILEDPAWLDGLARGPHDSYELEEDYYRDRKPRSRSQADRPPPRQYDDIPYSNRPSRDPQDPGFILPGGSNQRISADQRRKEAYRRQLEEQMMENQAHKRREKEDDLRVNLSGQLNVGGRPERQQLPDRRSAPPREPARWHEDTFSPRSILFDDPRKPHTNSILENGFEGLYKPSLLSQPLNIPAYPNDVNDAYSYYATRNPLDVFPSPGYQPAAIPLSDRPKVKFDDTPSKPDSHREAAKTPFPVEDDRSNKQKNAQKEYQEELKRQIEEQKLRKQREKEEKDRYDAKLDEEIRNYDPFGRGGGGAPMRDTEGNIIANLREVNLNSSDPYKKPAVQAPPPSTLDKSPGKEGATHERGGHGIFGEPISDIEKIKRNRYQDELRAQMEEKKRHQELEKEQQRKEEEQLLNKIAEDQRKMQEELESEKRKEREKQEAAQRQQEEIRRQQEEKRKEEEQRRREADDRRQDELRKQEEQQRRERQRQQEQAARGPSPPIPVLRSKTEPPASPALPAQRTSSRQSRVASADVLNQLAKMRAQLQSERKRVESDLKKEQEEPEVYDPRLQPKPQFKSNIDVFEIARKPVAVRRPPTETNPDNVREFQKLKNKDGSDSRSDFRKVFPQTPTSNDGLETQQRALINQQQEELDDLRTRRKPHNDQMNPQDLGLFRQGTTASATLLDSDSAFIGVPNGTPTPTNYVSGRNKRNESARSRHRLRAETPKSNQFGSVVSLDPDSINRKNDERLQRLRSLADDDTSLASNDPDEVLDRFMAKRQHTRPPSGQTLVDDSWMRPGTRVT